MSTRDKILSCFFFFFFLKLQNPFMFETAYFILFFLGK